MPLYDVLEEVAGQMNGLTVPGTTLAAAQSAVAFPKGTIDIDPNTPLLFVWNAGPVKERRQTMPRARGQDPTTGGFKLLDHQVGVFIVLLMTDAGAKNCQAYLELIEAVTNKLRLLTIPITLTNPDSGQVSTIELIGDDIVMTPSVPRSTGNDKLVSFRAGVTTTARELIRG